MALWGTITKAMVGYRVLVQRGAESARELLGAADRHKKAPPYRQGFGDGAGGLQVAFHFPVGDQDKAPNNQGPCSAGVDHLAISSVAMNAATSSLV